MHIFDCKKFEKQILVNFTFQNFSFLYHIFLFFFYIRCLYLEDIEFKISNYIVIVVISFYLCFDVQKVFTFNLIKYVKI